MIKLEKQSDLAALIGRLFYSSLFILYGYFKLVGFSGTVSYMAGQGLPLATLFAALAVIIELGGGLLMLVGFQTRCVALGSCDLYAGRCFHRPRAFWRSGPARALHEEHGDRRRLARIRRLRRRRLFARSPNVVSIGADARSGSITIANMRGVDEWG